MDPVLFDEENTWRNLLPLTFTRPVSSIRIGIVTIKEKWERDLGDHCQVISQTYLQKKFPRPTAKEALYINSSFCPNPALLKAVKALKRGHALVQGKTTIAYSGTPGSDASAGTKKTEYHGKAIRVTNLWDIFQKNGEAIQEDFDAITKNRMSLPLSRSVTVIGKKAQVFIEVGARAEACIFNTSGGPIYLDKGAEVMEGTAIRGPFCLGEHSVLKLNSKIYGPTTIGPQCKVGGEVNNSVIFGFSNKAHDGFLGNSVIGEWCNLGADTNNSNLKNNYGNVKLYNYLLGKQVDTGLQFCGLIMGDHSKSGINTMFNTGTVVGVGCNIYGGNFPPSHIPDFSWGGSEGFTPYIPEKLFETAERMFGRRQLKFPDMDKKILRKVFEMTGDARS
jgi:UDP-N-acetylglucosamine diphosphorylase/glucosamine-1-phosphate N-acetyltransferase